VLLDDMTNYRRFSRRLILCVLRGLSGGVIYYGGLKIYESFVKGQPGGLPVLILVTTVPGAFAMLTVAWHKLDSVGHHTIWPALCMLAGPIVLLPVYWALLPPPIPAAEGIGILTKLVGGYMILTLFLIEIQWLPMGWALDVSAIVIILTDRWIRLRLRRNDAISQ
jgi:hypothetical protein